MNEQPDSTEVSWRRARVLDTVVRISFVLAALGCALPCLYMKHDTGERDVVYGWTLLLLGWTGICGMQFAWFANILLVRAWASIRNDNYRVARRRLLIALALAANTFTWFLHPVHADEGTEQMMRLELLGVGFYFWVAAIVLPLAAIYWAERRSQKTERDNQKLG